HPVKDASLTGCRNSGGIFFSTERGIPNGMPFGKCRPLQVIYFSSLNGCFHEMRLMRLRGVGVQRADTEVFLFLELGENEVFSSTSGLLHCVRNDVYYLVIIG
ncbi:MAG: hypothetical protein LBQ78_00480, partial [Tannerellaceae bacterium]|nr:hypothetical protein [Tannerellaceae bacterium]